MRVDADDFARPCSCGREHQIAVKEILIEAGAVEKLEEEMSEGMLREYISPLVICDTNTYAATEELMEDIYDRCQVLVLDAEGLQADRHAIKIVENNMEEELLKETFGKKGVLEEIKKENEPELLESISPKHLEECLDGIAEIIDELPNEQDMFHLLEKAGCAKTVYDIGLDEAAVLPSLRLAPYTRRRLSLLRISKMLEIRGE